MNRIIVVGLAVLGYCIGSQILYKCWIWIGRLHGQKPL